MHTIMLTENIKLHTSWFQENIQTSSAFVLLSWDKWYLPGNINVNLGSKIRKPTKHDNKLVPKSPQTTQDATLK